MPEPQMSLSRLAEFLFEDPFGVGLEAASCTMRSLHVCLKEDAPETPLAAATKIMTRFDPLLALALKRGFKLIVQFTMDDGTWRSFPFSGS